MIQDNLRYSKLETPSQTICQAKPYSSMLLNHSDLSAAFQSLVFQPRNDKRRFPTLLILIINSSPSFVLLGDMIREPVVYWLYQTCKLLLQLQLKARVSCNYAPLLVSDHRNTRTLYILDGLSVSISKQASRYGLHSCLAWPMTESFAWCSCLHLLPGTWLIC